MTLLDRLQDWLRHGELNVAPRLLRECEQELVSAWAALGVSADEAAKGEDPDVAHLGDAIRVCRQHDEDRIEGLKTQLVTAREVLRELEWGLEHSCPSCGGVLGEHDAGCRLLSALGGGE